MHFEKSESYSLSPDEYLHKFQTPHQVISLKGSTQMDEQDIQIIEEILEERYNDNKHSEVQKKTAVLELDIIIKEWIASNYDKQLPSEYGLKIFGSYSLKANSYDGDIDMICIVPEVFTREKHFFGYLYEKLKANEHISQIFPIPEAYIPIIKLTFHGVQIDLLLSRISTEYLSQNPNLLSELEKFPISQKQLKCMNGLRTSLYLKKNITKYSNFQVALKAIKLWARNKGIYSQIYGYLGGAAFSIMLAKICQLYPNYSVIQLLDRFFFIYANWVWSLPVMLEQITYQEGVQDEMTIYTPFEPFINSAHGVSRCTSFITKKNLKAASQLIQDINKKKKNWKDLFEPVNFFEDYRYFLEISVMGENREDFVRWKGNVESKIRKFVRLFEQLQQQQEIPHNVELNPYPRAFNANNSNYKICVNYYMGLKINSNSQINDTVQVDFTKLIKDFTSILDNSSDISKIPKVLQTAFTCISKNMVPPEIKQAQKKS